MPQPEERAHFLYTLPSALTLDYEQNLVFPRIAEKSGAGVISRLPRCSSELNAALSLRKTAILALDDHASKQRRFMRQSIPAYTNR